MFVLKKSHTYTWPIKVQVPADGGKYLVQTFDATFLALPQDRIDEIVDGGKEAGSRIDTALLSEVLIGWKGVADEDKAEIPFGEEARQQLVAIPYVRKALVEGFYDSLAGAKRKN